MRYREQDDELLVSELPSPRTPRELAQVLAPRCRLLQNSVLAAIQVSGSQISRVAKEWRRLLFTDVDDQRFADLYAQTVTCVLLMARLQHAEAPLSVARAVRHLEGSHGLLAQVLATLTQCEELAGPIQLLERTIAGADPAVLLQRSEELWLYFYEDFLAAYDPKLRAEVGAYYTPQPVVHAQVMLVRELLTEVFDKRLGYADDGVLVLDPACGTGAYPYGIIREELRRVGESHGPGAIPSFAGRLAKNLVAFEIMVGPYAVAHMRLSEVLLSAGARLTGEGAQVYLCDTLESSRATGQIPLEGALYERLVSEHERARELKAEDRVMVCIGNPPYDRQAIEAGDEPNSRRGGWVRFGAEGEAPIFADFTRGAGVHAKNLYNDYVYFWRWALWKVFEQPREDDKNEGGIVCLITAASFLRGPGFAGLRRHMREVLDELWIIDLGGDARGPRKSANVFAIQTPVCIAIALRKAGPAPDRRARVHYTRLADRLDSAAKLALLGGITRLRDLEWKAAPDAWEASFVPGASGEYARWPRLVDLFPWRHSGAQWKRSWPVGETQELLERRWRALLSDPGRAAAFRETAAWTLDRAAEDLWEPGRELPPLRELGVDAPVPPRCRYAWRAFDRQWCLADLRLGDRLRPVLWQTHSEQQVYLTGMLSTDTVSAGPALVACADVPDLHHFRGSCGAADVLPLWRDAAASEANVSAGLLERLGRGLGREIGPADLFAYVYGVMAHPGFTELLHEELAEPGPRVPLTKEPRLFASFVELGRELIRLHTYGRRMSAEGWILSGAARCVEAVPQDSYPQRFSHDPQRCELQVGGGRFAAVPPAIWDYEVSGLRVLSSWLGFRMARRQGKASSPLDALRPARWDAAMTTELLELLWVLERTLELHARQRVLLEEVLAGPLFTADELPAPAPSERAPPRTRGAQAELPYAPTPVGEPWGPEPLVPGASTTGSRPE